MRFFIVFFLSSTIAFSQLMDSSVDDLGYESFAAIKRNPVTFTHIPFVLLRFNPSQMFGYNNTIQFGLELAPPFGKFSFAFDYGKGSGKWNFNKQVKNLQSSNHNTELRGEIRGYFSDWYPFYALDKKPFGRYYALEYINGKYERTLGTPAGTINNTATLPNNLKWINSETEEKTHVVHLKLGRHIHLHRHLFLDIFGGLGVGRSQFTALGETIPDKELFNPVKLNFVSNKMYENPKRSKYYFSKTFGMRIVVPL